ncbi:MAG: type IV toxin-antitoxin system AbiEi family antitoxin domain-containing protein [Thermoleophilaceae bacterium]
MRGKERTEVNEAIAELAERQHGKVSRRQLLRLGLGERAIEYRLAKGLLRPDYRGVYALGHRPHSRESRWMAAVLYAGEGAVLSHWSAASHWRLRPGTGPRSHVTVGRRKRSRPDITIHYGQLQADEVTEEQGIPVTTPARTLLDLAPLLPSPVLARMVEAAPSRGASVAVLLDRYPSRAGVPRLRSALATPTPTTRSDLEATILEAMGNAGLPRPEVNAFVDGYEVDFVWREHGVIAELDTYATHGSRAALERDRERDRKLALAEWRVVRMTGEDGLDDLKRLLAASAARSRRRHAQAA